MLRDDENMICVCVCSIPCYDAMRHIYTLHMHTVAFLLTHSLVLLFVTHTHYNHVLVDPLTYSTHLPPPPPPPLTLPQFPICSADQAISVACLDLHYSVTTRVGKQLKDEKKENFAPIVLSDLSPEDELNGSETDAHDEPSECEGEPFSPSLPSLSPSFERAPLSFLSPSFEGTPSLSPSLSLSFKNQEAFSLSFERAPSLLFSLFQGSSFSSLLPLSRELLLFSSPSFKGAPSLLFSLFQENSFSSLSLFQENSFSSLSLFQENSFSSLSLFQENSFSSLLPLSRELLLFSSPSPSLSLFQESRSPLFQP